MSVPFDEVGTDAEGTTFDIDCCAGEEVSVPFDEVGTDAEGTTLDIDCCAGEEVSVLFAPTKTKRLKRLCEITNQTQSKRTK